MLMLMCCMLLMGAYTDLKAVPVALLLACCSIDMTLFFAGTTSCEANTQHSQWQQAALQTVVFLPV